jgi:hypothetical protein
MVMMRWFRSGVTPAKLAVALAAIMGAVVVYNLVVRLHV